MCAIESLGRSRVDCREGLKELLQILSVVIAGPGSPAVQLDEAARLMHQGSFIGVSTLRFHSALPLGVSASERQALLYGATKGRAAFC